MRELLAVMTEIDFVTCGIKPKGELFLRASKVSLDSEKLKAKTDQREVFPLEAACRLVQVYVKGQEIIFNPHRVSEEDWLIKSRVWALMNCALSRPLKMAIEFRDRIEDAASASDLYAVALDIIHEYETYLLHKSAITNHIKAQRKIVDSKNNGFFIALEKRDGSFCKNKNCESGEKLVIDHIKPLSLGGLSELGNLQLLCRLCNGIKGDRPMDYLLRRTNKWRNLAIK